LQRLDAATSPSTELPEWRLPLEQLPIPIAVTPRARDDVPTTSRWRRRWIHSDAVQP
jgi:hypothetical protein